MHSDSLQPFLDAQLLTSQLFDQRGRVSRLRSWASRKGELKEGSVDWESVIEAEVDDWELTSV